MWDALEINKAVLPFSHFMRQMQKHRNTGIFKKMYCIIFTFIFPNNTSTNTQKHTHIDLERNTPRSGLGCISWNGISTPTSLKSNVKLYKQNIKYETKFSLQHIYNHDNAQSSFHTLSPSSFVKVKIQFVVKQTRNLFNRQVKYRTKTYTNALLLQPSLKMTHCTDYTEEKLYFVYLTFLFVVV